MELVREAAADRAAVSFDGTELDAEPPEDPLVGLEHHPVLAIGVGIVHVKRVAVFHDELASTHQTEARTDLIAKLRLDLKHVDRELLVARDDLADDIRHDLFVRRPQAEVGVFAVLKTQQLLAVELPPAALFPELARLHNGHQQFLAAVLLELFPHDRLELADTAQRERQVVVDARRDSLDHAGAHHELLADDVCVARSLAIGANEEL